MTAIEITPRSSKTSAWPPTAQMSFLLSIANCGSFFIPELFSIIPSVKKTKIRQLSGLPCLDSVNNSTASEKADL